MPSRLLIVSDYDPTSPLVGALRVDKFAVHLTQQRWDVRVVSRAGVTEYLTSGERIAPLGAEGQHFERPLRSPLRRKSRAMAAAVYRRFIAFPDRGVFSVRRILRSARTLGEWRPDVILVSGPPFSTFIVGARLAQEWSVPWLADYRDLWTNSTYYLCGSVRRRLDAVVERALLKSCSLAVTVSAPLAEDLRRDFGVPAEVVMNGFEPHELTGPPVAPPPGLPLTLTYTGEIYEGKRDPSALFEGLALSGLSSEEIQVVFRGITVLPLKEQAERMGVGHLVDVGPALPREECLRLQKKSDVLLLLMWNDPREAGTYSGKLFEYLGSGRPTLMLGWEDGVAANLIVGRRAGVVSNDAQVLASILRSWVEEKRGREGVPPTPPNVTDGLTRKDQAEVLAEILTRHLSERDSDRATRDDR